MAWRLCTVVVVLCAWQACMAQDLVSLLPPWKGKLGPGLGQVSHFRMFDGDKSTYATSGYVRYGATDNNGNGNYFFPYRATGYRITMPAHVKPADYPTDWTVRGTLPPRIASRYSGDWVRIQLDRVSGAVFKKRVYEGVFTKPRYFAAFSWNFKKGKFAIAEIELLGPRAELNALWPYGKYPCSQRLEVITQSRGPKRIFSRSKGTSYLVRYGWLRQAFAANPRHTDGYSTMFFNDNEPIIIGGWSPELVNAREVVFKADEGLTESGRGGDLPVAKIILQGNVCAGGRCSKTGSKGWVKLAVATKPRGGVRKWPAGARLPIEKPGNYEALRLKLVPSDGGVRIDFDGVFFLGCKA